MDDFWPRTFFATCLFQLSHEDVKDANNPTFIDSDNPETTHLTRSSFRLWSKRFAIGLQKAGLQLGDGVLLFSGNNLFLPVVFMGITMAGGIFPGTNPSYVNRELAYQLKGSESKFLIFAEDSVETGIAAASMISVEK